MACMEAIARLTPAELVVDGGVHPMKPWELFAPWWLWSQRQLTRFELRTYFACVVVEHTRRTEHRRFSIAEFERLLGEGSGGGVQPERGAQKLRAAFRRLEELGLAKIRRHSIAFPRSRQKLAIGEELDESLGVFKTQRRPVPVPRRVLRELARGMTPAQTATTICQLIRCLWWKQNEGYQNVGRCSASMIARTCGISVRSVIRARKALGPDGRGLFEVLPVESGEEWAVNTYGRRIRVNLRWGSKAAENVPDVSPPSTRINRRLSPPRIRNKDMYKYLSLRSTENTSTPPNPAQPSGVYNGSEEDPKRPQWGQTPPPRRRTRPPNVFNVVAEDFSDLKRAREIAHQASRLGWVPSGELGLQETLTLMERAKRCSKTPAKLLGWLLRQPDSKLTKNAQGARGRGGLFTIEDERVALARLRESRPEDRVAAKPKQRPRLSADARFAEAVEAAAAMTKFPLSPFHIALKERGWTRERWEQAQRERLQAQAEILRAHS